MHEALTLPLLGLIGCCVLLEIGAHVCFKAASNASAKSGAALLSLHVFQLGIFLAAVEIVSWIAVLQWAPLTVAFPIMTLTYVGIPMAGVVLLKEHMAPRQFAGAALVATGVICVAFSGL